MSDKIDRSRIVQTAVNLLKETGDFSLTAVAHRLGIKTPSLYVYVRGLPQLRKLVIEQLHDEIATNVDPRSEWKEAIRVVARTQREHLARYPTLIVSLGQEPARSDSALTALENLTTVLLNAGFVGTEIRSIVGTLDLLVIGASVDATAPIDIYPRKVVAGQGPLPSVFGTDAGRDPEQLFEFALECLIRAFSSLKDQRAP